MMKLKLSATLIVALFMVNDGCEAAAVRDNPRWTSSGAAMAEDDTQEAAGVSQPHPPSNITRRKTDQITVRTDKNPTKTSLLSQRLPRPLRSISSCHQQP